MHRLPAILLITTSLSAAEVRVFAAVSLTEALEEIARGYTRDEIVFHFGASSLLARQIEQGAPADLFLSADEERVDALAKKGLIASRVSVLSNTLVVVGVPLARARSIALAEPSSVPAGVYARQWLQRIGMWQRVAPKVIPTENVRAALSAVEAGNADAAIVYKTDARIAKRARIVFEVPRKEGPPISYPFALLRDSEHRDAAIRFLQHLRSKSALRIFAKHGFLIQ
jgi:molybdate transport system substrate-binding protein